MKKKKIVVIGGGNGSAKCAVALKQNIELFNISIVVSVADSGGSSGRLRKEFKTLPPGDIMRAVLALSKYDYAQLRQIFYQPRFESCDKLDGHNVGNLFLVLAAHYSGDFVQALNALAQSVQAQGVVYPVTLEQVDLVAQLTNGDIIRTEAFIDVPTYNRGWKIKRAWLEPAGKIYAEADRAIRQAEYIIISPGSLYTSLVATLLPAGVKEAIAASKAQLIYVVGNAYRTDHETGPERLSDFVVQLEHYLPRQLDLVIHNNHRLTLAEKAFYREKKWGVFEPDVSNLANHTIMSVDFEKKGGGLCSIKLGKIFKKLL